MSLGIMSDEFREIVTKFEEAEKDILAAKVIRCGQSANDDLAAFTRCATAAAEQVGEFQQRFAGSLMFAQMKVEQCLKAGKNHAHCFSDQHALLARRLQEFSLEAQRD